MTLSDSSYRALKRLQVATGASPIGLFLLLHLWTNGHALQGAAAFNREVGRIGRLPHLPLIETLLVALPIAVHIGLGLTLARTAQAAEDGRGFPAPWMLVAQRVTGFFLVVYLVFHVWSLRLSPARIAGAPDLFALTAKQLAEPGWFAFQSMGVAAAAFHFGNGLVATAGPWGLNLPPRARRIVAGLGAAAFAGLTLAGIGALFAFSNPAMRWLERAR
jgi:succinate dehydrogenase / fumarate reductase cytochrome b subunit